MQTMVDELYDRGYQAGRTDLNSSIFALLRGSGEALANAFRVLNRIEYAAPWSKPGQNRPL
jgi:hypothetical protein